MDRQSIVHIKRLDSLDLGNIDGAGVQEFLDSFQKYVTEIILPFRLELIHVMKEQSLSL